MESLHHISNLYQKNEKWRTTSEAKIESTKSYYNFLWITMVQISCAAPHEWNTLSDDIRTSQSLFAFKRADPQYFSADLMYVFQNRFHVAVRLFSNRLQHGVLITDDIKMCQEPGHSRR